MRLAYDDAGGSRSSLMTALGVFLVVGAVYIATGSGRIDIIDGQLGRAPGSGDSLLR